MAEHDLFDLSRRFDEFRDHLLEILPGEFAHWPVLHLVFPGETLPENNMGVGPWARIWSARKATEVLYESRSSANRPAKVSYVIGVYVPRVFTTDDLVETLIHEYLHIGKLEGTTNYHAPRQEEGFISQSKALAETFRAICNAERSGIDDLRDWNELRRRDPGGLTIREDEIGSILASGRPLQPVSLMLGSIS